jgi:hypothetical protein
LATSRSGTTSGVNIDTKPDSTVGLMTIDADEDVDLLKNYLRNELNSFTRCSNKSDSFLYVLDLNQAITVDNNPLSCHSSLGVSPFLPQVEHFKLLFGAKFYNLTLASNAKLIGFSIHPQFGLAFSNVEEIVIPDTEVKIIGENSVVLQVNEKKIIPIGFKNLINTWVKIDIKQIGENVVNVKMLDESKKYYVTDNSTLRIQVHGLKVGTNKIKITAKWDKNEEVSKEIKIEVKQNTNHTAGIKNLSIVNYKSNLTLEEITLPEKCAIVSIYGNLLGAFLERNIR